MSVIMVVAHDPHEAQNISETLRSEGWGVQIAADVTESLAGAESPRLVLAAVEIPRLDDLLARFARRRGGPGVIAVAGASQPVPGSADAVVERPFTSERLLQVVRRELDAAPAESRDDRQRQLTSAEIFADVLAEVEADIDLGEPETGSPAPTPPKPPPPQAAPPKPPPQASAPPPPKPKPRARPADDDIDRKLEKTLSGVLDLGGPRRSPAPRSPEARDETDIEDLLDKTLSSLQIPKRPRRPARREPPPQEATAPEPPRPTPPEPAPEPPAELPAEPKATTPEPTAPPIEPPAEDLEIPKPELRVPELDVPELEPLQIPELEATPEEEDPFAGLPDELAAPPESPIPAVEAPAAPERPEPSPFGDGFDADFELEPSPFPEIEEEPAFTAEPDDDPFAERLFDEEEPPAEDTGAAPLAEDAVAEDAVAEDVAPEDAEPEHGEPAEDDFELTPLPGLDTQIEDYRTRQMPSLDSLAQAEQGQGETFGEYTLLDRIAIGGMAEVWKARRRGVEGFQKTVAIKRILSHLTSSPDFITMFIDEAKLAAQLNHDNIIQIYDLGKQDDDFFIAMEYVEGMDLRTIFMRSREKGMPLPPGLALLIAARVGRALDYAHRKRDFDNRELGLVHRDVSPQNVLISYEGEIKLCDFGIVKAAAKASTTQMGALKGKLQYMSPEQAQGHSVDARSDIFSLGSVTFEMLTGRKLFTAESEIGVLDAVRECDIPPLDELPAEMPGDRIERIILKALAKDPDERYQTAGEMEQELEAVLHQLPSTPSLSELAAYVERLQSAPAVAAEPSQPGAAPATEPDLFLETPGGEPRGEETSEISPEPAKTSRKKWLFLAIAAIVIAAIIAGAWYFMGQDPPAEPPGSEPASAPAETPPTGDEAPAGEAEPGEGENAASGGDTAQETMTEEEIEAMLAETVAKASAEVEENVRRDYEARAREIQERLRRTQEENSELEAELSASADPGADGGSPEEAPQGEPGSGERPSA